MTVVKPGDRVARVRAQLLHILYEIGREDHQFRLRYNGQYLRDAFFLEDYNLESNAVIHMVPLSNEKDVRQVLLFARKSYSYKLSVYTEFQIREGNEDKSKIIFLISQ